MNTTFHNAGRVAATLLLTDPRQVILVQEREAGYWLSGDPFGDEREAARHADEINTSLGVTPAMRELLVLQSHNPRTTATLDLFKNALPLVDKFQQTSVPSLHTRSARPPHTATDPHCECADCMTDEQRERFYHFMGNLEEQTMTGPT